MSNPNRPDHQEMADQFDRKLAQILREGQRVLDPETGQVQLVDPTAATLNVIKGRLKDLGMTRSSAPKGSAANQLREAAAARGFVLDDALPDTDIDGEDPAS